MIDWHAYRSLRGRIMGLPAAIDRSTPAGEGDDRAVVDRARAFAAALRSHRPTPPAFLSSPEMLARIYDSAARACARRLGPSVLRRTFAPATRPRDVAWVHATDRPELVHLLGTGLPQPPAIDLAGAMGATSRARRSRVRQAMALAAAMLVAVSAFMVFRGTSASFEPVFQVADRPMSADHPSDFLRGLIDR